MVILLLCRQPSLTSSLRQQGAQTIRSATVIQSLWSGYGEIVRLELEGSAYPSVILKHIKLPEAGSHPRGWNTGRSHARKIRSYQVEAHWYQDYAHQCDSDCLVPGCLAVNAVEDETVLVLTDLDAAGFGYKRVGRRVARTLRCGLGGFSSLSQGLEPGPLETQQL